MRGVATAGGFDFDAWVRAGMVATVPSQSREDRGEEADQISSCERVRPPMSKDGLMSDGSIALKPTMTIKLVYGFHQKNHLCEQAVSQDTGRTRRGVEWRLP